MIYGLPYKGRKNAIAAELVQQMPPARVFVDLFCGGCAVTHAAMLSGKWERFVANDIDGRMPRMFADAAAGKYANETRWISREDFFRLKDTDPYVAVCWSFGSNMTNYLYSVESEPWKRALHHARVLGDRSLLREFGINGDGGKRDILSHAREYSDKYIRWYLANVPHGDADFVTLRRPQNLSRVQNLERLRAVQSLRDLRNLERLRIVQSLEGLRNLEKLEIRGGDYRDLPIPEGATVYADIPYRATSGYTEEGFDHAAFYDWCRTREFPVFVSEYHMPDDFVPLWKKHKTSTFAGSGRHKKTIECLFVHERFFDQTKTTLF